MESSSSSHNGYEFEPIEEYRSIRRGDELVNSSDVRGIYLGQREGVAVLFPGQKYNTRDLFQFDNPDKNLRRIIYKQDNDEKREKSAVEAKQKALSGLVSFIPLWMGSRENIRSRFDSSLIKDSNINDVPTTNYNTSHKANLI